MQRNNTGEISKNNIKVMVYIFKTSKAVESDRDSKT